MVGIDACRLPGLRGPVGVLLVIRMVSPVVTNEGNKTMTETTYNGWKNYPTWAVNLWLSNDEGLYNATREMVAEVASATESTSEYWTLEESHRFNTADVLKTWVVDELAPDLGATFAADLLGYALELVDWHEIANAWLEEAS